MPGIENWELNKTKSAHAEHTLMEERELATSNSKAARLVIMRYIQCLEAQKK